MSENKICDICGGYVGNVVIRRLPARNADDMPYPEATVPPINVCPGHPSEEKPMQASGTIAANNGFSPFIVMHEYDPSKELVYIPAATDASIFPNNYVQRQEVLWEIAQAVAAYDYEHGPCPFCKRPFVHDADCIVLKARTSMEWREAQPKITIQVRNDFSPAVSPIAEIARELAEKIKDLNGEVPGD